MLIKFPNIYVQNSEHNVFLFTVRNVKTVQYPNPDNEDNAVQHETSLKNLSLPKTLLPPSSLPTRLHQTNC